MSLYKRDNMWWIDFTTASGERIRRSAEDAKNGDDLHVSLNNLAVEVLQRQHGKHPERVFTY